MTLLSREQIMGADDYRERDILVPEWGGTVRIKSLMGDERDRFEELVAKRRESEGNKKGLVGVRALLVSLVCIDENGTRLFSEADVIQLGCKSAKAMERIFDPAMEMNGLSKKDVEELEGNSEAAPSGNSGSSSPAQSSNAQSQNSSES